MRILNGKFNFALREKPIRKTQFIERLNLTILQQ